jgi:hypothetical protein
MPRLYGVMLSVFFGKARIPIAGIDEDHVGLP